MSKKLRGKQLTEQLIIVLEEMKKLGYNSAPISRSTVQRRLGLKSRGSLLLDGRDLLIDTARRQQLHDAGLDSNTKKRRKSNDEYITSLKNEIEELKKVRDNLTEKLAQIINGLEIRGFNVEEIMMPLRPNKNKKR